VKEEISNIAIDFLFIEGNGIFVLFLYFSGFVYAVVNVTNKIFTVYKLEHLAQAHK